MNIILIGVTGSGKTTIGEKLAVRLGGNWRFYDADHSKASRQNLKAQTSR